MKRRVIMVAGLAVVVCALVVWVVLAVKAPSEPSYEGKKLSVWLQAAGSTNATESVTARRAIGRMGSNAVPYMIHRLKGEGLKNWYWLKKADKLFHTGTKFEQMNGMKVLGLRRGLIWLGLPVVPELERVMEESSNEEVLYEAYSAAETIVSIRSDSRSNQLSLSSNAVAKVTEAIAKHGGGATVSVRAVIK